MVTHIKARDLADACRLVPRQRHADVVDLDIAAHGDQEQAHPEASEATYISRVKVPILGHRTPEKAGI